MIECLLAWSCLIAGIGKREPILILAAAVFAVAANIDRLRRKD